MTVSVKSAQAVRWHVVAIGLTVCSIAYGEESWVTAPPRRVASEEDNQPCWIAVGRADAEDAAHEKLARQNAQWLAVEAHFRARGVSDEKLRKDTSKIQEAIASHAETIFSREEVLEDCVQDGQYCVHLRTYIRPSELAKWLFIAGADMKQFYTWWSSPSVVVTIDDERSRRQVQDCLLKHGFEIISRKVREENDRYSADAYTIKEETIRALCREYKSEIIVDGHCQLTPRDAVEYKGQTVYAYDGTLSIEVIDTTTAKIIVSKEWSYRAQVDDHTTDFERQGALRKCQVKLLDLHASGILYEILFYYFDWRIGYSVQFLQTPASARASIIDCLKSVPDLELTSDDFDNGVMEIKVKYMGDPESIIGKVRGTLPFELRRKARGLLIFGGRGSGG